MVEIIPYQESWKCDFVRIRDRIAQALGIEALRIDHIGSTAVEGLPAKDVIDIQITVCQLTPKVAQCLTDAGFARHPKHHRDHVPPGRLEHSGDWEKMLFTQAPGFRRANIHVRQEGRPNQRFALLMRDFLRAHPAHAQAYAALKLRLAAGLRSSDDYAHVKDPAVDLIYFAAEAWASQMQWTPA